VSAKLGFAKNSLEKFNMQYTQNRVLLTRKRKHSLRLTIYLF